MVQTKNFECAPFFCGISTDSGGYNRAEIKKEGRKQIMKEFLFQIATFFLATVQAAGLMWVTGVFAR